jgi:diguanylate cyclase (GGDEF)-like protein/PAS domain S-box-containing protein
MIPKIQKPQKTAFRTASQNHFFQYSLVLTIFCLFTVLLIYSLAYQVITGNIKQSLIQVAEQGSARVHDRLNGYLNFLEAISTIDTINNPGIAWRDKQRILRSIAGQKYFSLKRISLAIKNGDAQTSDGAKLNVRDRLYFQKALSGCRYVSDPLVSRVDGSAVIVFAVPVYYHNRITGALYATHSVEALCDITDKIKMSRQSYSLIINKQGLLIAHPNRALIYSGKSIFVRVKTDNRFKPLLRLKGQMLARKIGTGEYFYQGIQKYMGFAPIEGTDWSFAITAPRKYIFGPMDKVLFILALLILLVFALFLVLNFNNISLKQSLDHEQSILKSAIDTAHIILIETNQRGLIIAFNHYAEEFLGFSHIETVGKISMRNLIPSELSESILEILEHVIESHEPLHMEFPIVKKSGEIIHILWSINSNHHLIKGLQQITLLGVDITERVAHEKKLLENNHTLSMLYQELEKSETKLRNLAYYDPLTGLSNRFSLFEQSSIIIANAIRDHIEVALLYLDIDDFKLINDTFGHSLGDSLLKEFGSRLSSSMNDSKVFRIGGDEFVAIFPKIMTKAALFPIITKMMKHLTRPFHIQEHIFHISVSVGITFFPENGENIEELMKNADTAMYKAKESGNNAFVFFDRSMNDSIVAKVKLESAIRLSLEQNTFSIVYQPQVEAFTGKVVSFEALLRWPNTEFDVPPAEFIKVAEETGLIIPIGLWVLEEACKFAAKLQAEGIPNLIISVNISTRQLKQNNFVSSVKQIITKTNIPPQNIGLEITETALMESFETNLEKLRSMCEFGVGIYLDDFGTGYSSLNYLRNLPIHIIKIDKSFVEDIDHELQQSLITTIITMAHRMHLQVIAEGVETREQLQFLLNNQCDTIQGFLFSKPVTEEKALNIARIGVLIPKENP